MQVRPRIGIIKAVASTGLSEMPAKPSFLSLQPASDIGHYNPENMSAGVSGKTGISYALDRVGVVNCKGVALGRTMSAHFAKSSDRPPLS